MGTRRRRVSVKECRSKLVKWDDLCMELITNPTQESIKMAAKGLKEGQLVAFPTETVYGLGADATNSKAVSRIYSVKGRPVGHPLIVHILSMQQIYKWAVDIPEYAEKLANEFWPGPMTLILKRSELAKDFITGGQNNVGLRVPAQPVALALLKEFEKLGGSGIAAPSANRFGAVSPTTAAAVQGEIGKYLDSKDFLLDGGASLVGIESTIIGCTSEIPLILRPGAITADMVKASIKIVPSVSASNSSIRVSGMLPTHYAPNAKVKISGNTKPGDGFIALSNIPTPDGAVRLAAPNDLEEYAKLLYTAFRAADFHGLTTISVIPPNGGGIALAIRDRLIKASG
jgi:L-threonylcarbamoyladenylate synthase